MNYKKYHMVYNDEFFNSPTTSKYIEEQVEQTLSLIIEIEKANGVCLLNERKYISKPYKMWKHYTNKQVLDKSIEWRQYLAAKYNYKYEEGKKEL